jgi:hypothetical protein
MRYNHWFWNSSFISKIECVAIKVSSYLWNKQYNRGP